MNLKDLVSEAERLQRKCPLPPPDRDFDEVYQAGKITTHIGSVFPGGGPRRVYVFKGEQLADVTLGQYTIAVEDGAVIGRLGTDEMYLGHEVFLVAKDNAGMIILGPRVLEFDPEGQARLVVVETSASDPSWSNERLFGAAEYAIIVVP